MIFALGTAGFFIAVTAVLRFSTWAEAWLERGGVKVPRAPVVSEEAIVTQAA